MNREAPRVSLRGLDELWFQISGTLCNLACTHCFISCSPTNHAFEILPSRDVLRALEESRSLGVKEYYFTGGEPLLHPDIVEILEATLELGPATVLTNGVLLKPAAVERLARAESRSIYSLELRVSIDGPSPETNDPIRGRGTFAKAMAGVRLLLDHGFLPVVTVAETWEDGEEARVFDAFVTILREAGYSHPRIKIIPTLRIGAEVARHRGYLET
ncbi:MAG: radical SAM protein, partial [Vicinamibacteria bacterium]